MDEALLASEDVHEPGADAGLDLGYLPDRDPRRVVCFEQEAIVARDATALTSGPLPRQRHSSGIGLEMQKPRDDERHLRL